MIIPVYNCDQYLQICLDSILSQTYQNLEVICVDDGSTDGSVKMLDYYAQNDYRVKVVHRKKAGVSAARNYAMSLVSGDYVMFVDADDWLEKNAIGDTLKFSIEYDLDICSFSYISERENGKSYKSLYNKSVIFDEFSSKIIGRRIIGPIEQELKYPLMLDSYGTIWAKLYKRSIVIDLKFVDLEIIGSAEDSLFNMYAYRNAKRVGYFHHFFYHYRKNNQGSETKKYRPKLKECWKNQYEIIRREFNDLEAKDALNNRIAINHFGLILNYMKSENPSQAIIGLYEDPLYRQSIESIKLTYMSFIWRMYFYLVKNKFVIPIIIFHKLFSVAIRLF